jgi:hypothetical protein
MKTSSMNTSKRPVQAQRLTGNPESSPDFRRELVLVLLDASGEELFRSAPLFSAVEAERIGGEGVDEFFTLRLAESSQVQRSAVSGCVVVSDLSGNEIFRSPAFLSASDASKIGQEGIEECFAVTIVPAAGVKYSGLKWNACHLHWDRVESRELIEAA